jgi:2,3,4,5-tetrahydropyridine-2,6-dicarboxylate N-succinyltransferase
MADLEALVHELWERRAQLTRSDEDARRIAASAIDLLDRGQARVAEVSGDGGVVVHEWLREAILLFFQLSEVSTVEFGPFEYVDKVPLKRGFAELGVRVVPGASARWGSFLERDVVMMPSYVNIGSRVGTGSMVDTWATVGSCAQVGARVHLAGGVGIGGVLEPPNAVPVIVEDDATIFSRCMVVEGARVGKGAVLGAGTILTGSTHVFDAETGEEFERGVVPSWSVAVGASRRREFPGGEFFMPCVLVLRRLQPGEKHDKAKLNAVLRDAGFAG